MIKVVSFDIGGTLIKGINNNHSITMFSEMVNKDYHDVKYAYRDIFQKREGKFDELITLFCNRLNIKLTDEIIEFFKKNFNQECYFDKDSLNIIKKLKDMGYKVILFSNNSSMYPDNLDKEIYSLVDDIFYSHIIGYTKDESESYKYIENKLGFKPQEFLHIGDSFDNDYLYPRQNGWNALFYGNKEGIRCINKLDDIFKYLEKEDNYE